MSVTLLNGATDPRTRSSESCLVLDCGCAFVNEGREYAQMCGAHYAEWSERHASALSEHTNQQDQKPGQEKTP